MSIYLFSAFSWILFFWFRWLTKQQKVLPASKKFTRSNLVKTSVYAYFKKFFFFASIIYTLLILILLLMNYFSQTANPSWASFLFNKLTKLQATYSLVDEKWKIISIFLFLLLLTSFIVRIIRTNTKNIIASVSERFKNGDYEMVEDSEAIRQLKEKRNKEVSSLNRLNAYEPMNATAFQAIEVQKENVRAGIQKLDQEILYHQFLNTVQVEIDKQSINQNVRGFWNKLLIFFGSVGMYRFSKKTQSILASFASILLILSLLTVQTIQLSGASESVSYDLANLVVKNKVSKLNSEWEKALEQNYHQDPTPLDQNEAEIISKFSKISEAQILQSFLSDLQTDSTYEYKLASLNTRTQLLAQYAASQNLNSDHSFVSESPFRENPEQIDGAERLFSKELDTRYTAYKTTVGENLEKEITKAVTKSPEVERKSIISRLNSFVNSFSEPVSTKEILSSIYGKVIDNTAGKIETLTMEQFLQESNLTSTFKKKIASKTFHELFNNSFEEKTKKFLLSILIDKQKIDVALKDIKSNGVNVINNTFNEIANSSSSFSELNKRVVTSTTNRPPSITYTDILAPDQSDLINQIKTVSSNQAELQTERYIERYNLTEERINALKTALNKNDLAENLQTLTSYEDFFPNYLKAEENTLMSSAIKGSNVEELFKVRSVATASEEIFSSAFNFLSLLGNNRIGGVLIGREPEHFTQPLMVDDMTWAENGNSVDIYLYRNNTSIKIGSFQKSLVAQAIAYSSDGRPVTTTMIKTLRDLPLKVLVHPALVDTKLGCDIIQLDRFVDTYARPDKSVYTYINSFLDQGLLYDACAYYLLAEKYIGSTEEQEEVQSLNRKYSQVLAEDYLEIKDILKDGDALKSPSLSPFTVKKNYYNQQLVSAIIEGLSTSSITDGTSFLEFISSRVPVITSLDDLLITKSEVWSGVRELPYTLDENFEFLQYDIADPFKCLTFIEQVAYTRHPFCTKKISPEYDSNPWEFTYLKENHVIENLILPNISTPKNRTIVQNALEFTILQRLFRNIFNGNFGWHFPVAKIELLMNNCLHNVEFVETTKWSSPVNIEGSNPDDPFVQLIKVVGVNKRSGKLCE